MTKAIANTYDLIGENLKRINHVFLGACLFLIILYAFNIFSVISRTVALQKVEAQISTLGSSVNNFDSEYLHLSGRITPDNLTAYGMSQGKVSEYITRLSGSNLGVAENFNHVATVHEL